MSEGKEDRGAISATGLTVKFGPILALDNFTTNMPPGIVGLLGPNGAGKSTFIKTMLGLVEEESGNILVNGHNPKTDLTTFRDTIGYMPEHDCLIPSLNAVELVSYLGRISGLTSADAKQRTHEVLDFVGIGEERYRKIESYSTGMKQKAKLAQAIVHDPDLLLFDEPTNGMDPQGRVEMLELINKIGATGKSILVSSHILQEVEQVCEHVIIINQGRVVKEGDIKTLMMGEEGRYKLKIRGTDEAMDLFEKELSSTYTIVFSESEWGQRTLIITGEKKAEAVFKAASTHKVQVRHYGPDKLSLEDVFIETFREGSRWELTL